MMLQKVVHPNDSQSEKQMFYYSDSLVFHYFQGQF